MANSLIAHRSSFTLGFVPILLFIVSSSCSSDRTTSAEDMTAVSLQAATTADASASNAAEVARIQAYLDSRYTTKDILHSFVTKAGQTIDCIDFFAQPGAKALAARGTPVTQIPSPPPLPRGVPSSEAIPDFAFNGEPDPNGQARTCSGNSVPLVRITVAEILAAGGLDAYLAAQTRRVPPDTNERTPGYAHVREQFNAGTNPQIYYGESTLSVDAPAISIYPINPSFVGSHSLSQVWTFSGTARYPDSACTPPNSSCTQTVEAGVTSLYSSAPYPSFFVYSTNDGYGEAATPRYCPPPPVGCPNDGWMAYLGGSVANNTNIYSYNSPGFTWTQSDLRIIVESYNSNWWIYTAGSWIGYFPGSYFTGTFPQYATSFQAGAEVYDAQAANTGQWLVPMGTGIDANAGLGQAAYQHDLYGCNLGPSCSTSFTPLGGSRNQYNYSTSTPGAPNWVNYFFFGTLAQPGSYTQTCNQCTQKSSYLPYSYDPNAFDARLECECLGANGREDSTLSLPCTTGINNYNGQLACSGPTQPGGSYTQSCVSCSWNSKFLTCYCNNGQGSSQWSTLGLPCDNNTAIGNMNGTLNCPTRPSPPGGSYGSSCRYCSWTSSSMQCECSNGTNWMTTSVALPCAAGVTNTNGQLTCNGSPAQPSGSYTGSCRNCTWTSNSQSSSLKCQCQAAGGIWVFASVHIPCPSTISNSSGRLQCD